MSLDRDTGILLGRRITKLLPFSWAVVAPHNLLLILQGAGSWESMGHVQERFCS